MRDRIGTVLCLIACTVVLARDGQAITYSPFGPNGEGGSLFGQSLQIGAGGEAYLVDAFLRVDGVDLNGAAIGVAAQLSTDSLPSGLDLVFDAQLSLDQTDLLLTYSFQNNTGAALSDLVFLSLLDAEIDSSVNTAFDEFGAVAGTPGPGQGYEIDELGFAGGDLLPNLLLGALDGTNSLPSGSEDDVAFGLSLAVGSLPNGATSTFQVMISEDGDTLAGIALSQHDADVSSTTVVTYSSLVLPEPSTGCLLLLSLVPFALRRRLSGGKTTRLASREGSINITSTD